jgi:hypothetical protein
MYTNRVKSPAVALSCLLGTSALHAEWKVATVRMTDLFHHHPEVIAYREEVKEKKLKIPRMCAPKRWRISAMKSSR